MQTIKIALCRNGIALLAAAIFAANFSAAQIADTPFLQDIHMAYPIDGAPVNAVAALGEWVYAGTDDGLYALRPGMSPEPQRLLTLPVHALVAVNRESPESIAGQVVALTPLQQFLVKDHATLATHSFSNPLMGFAYTATESTQVLDGMILRGDQSFKLPLPGSIHDVLYDRDGKLWIATDMGLYGWEANRPLTLIQSADEILGAAVATLALDRGGRLWAGGLGGITIFENGRKVKTLAPADGLPSVNISAIAQGPDGRMWVGTRDNGVARWDGTSWSVRQSRRWLLSDSVNDIAFDKDGTAWIATDKGLSAISQREMTLAEKADYFQDVTYKRHIRKPYIVEKCVLETPGNLATWRAEDDDNDGSYTALFMIAEAFRWKVTEDSRARENVEKMWDFLVSLVDITGTDGFVARTIIPADWDHMHDPNRTWSAEEKQLAFLHDPRFKPVENRWIPTADGKWLWKRDTSSDEITGHFLAFHMYYDLVASEEEKPAVRDHVRRVMDYIMDGGYNLIDIDGTPTRWGVWSPDSLLDDPNWQAERGINALEMLSYLKTSWHITGDEKYKTAYDTLIADHHYADYARHAKTYNPSWVTHIDTELLTFAYPGLVPFETDPELTATYRASLDEWFSGVRNEQNPQAIFTYAALTGEHENFGDAVDFLRATPLDLVSWYMDLGTREDLKMVRTPIVEDKSMNRLVPADERHTVRWDKNPWRLLGGESGNTEWAPTFWLLPYWMGRYYGFIDG